MMHKRKGRPLRDNEGRSEVVTVRMPERTKKLFEDYAKSNKLSVSEVVYQSAIRGISQYKPGITDAENAFCDAENGELDDFLEDF